jgi:D-arginine dehydrogenase
MASLGDATPCEPCDAQPEELDVALIADRVERETTLRVRRIPHRWAGLRAFVADGAPVVGLDPRAPDFLWLAGQGGYGIMMAPVLARAAAGLATTRAWPATLTAAGVAQATLSPSRPL